MVELAAKGVLFDSTAVVVLTEVKLTETISLRSLAKQCGVEAQVFAKVIVHEEAIPPVPTVTNPATSVPEMLGEVPQVPTEGELPED